MFSACHRPSETALAYRPVDVHADFRSKWERLEIHEQAIRSTMTGAIVTTEALVRWRRDPGELWAAAMVFPIAEEAGLAAAFSRRALEMSIVAWTNSTRRADGSRLALNMHQTQLEGSDPIHELVGMCNDLGVSPTELIFEIPDQFGTAGCRAAVATLAPMLEAGATIALDDHRGEASQTRPGPDWLPTGSIVKLDAAITDLCDHPLGKTVLEQTAGQLLDQGYVVGAEKMERPEQFRAARECGVTLAQGHLLDPPSLLT